MMGSSQVKRHIPWAMLIPLSTLMVVLVIPAVLPGVLAPHDPLKVNLEDGLTPPVWAGGTSEHILGTDSLGRDSLSRLVYGARTSALISLAVVLLSATFGSALGVIAGYAGGWLDAFIMRVADAFFSLPLLLMAIALATLIGPSFTITVSVMVGALWAQYSRLMRAETISIKKRDFVTYARTTGVSAPTIAWRHVRPNIQNSIIVLATLHVGWAILVEAALSFIGAGVPPPNPTWGILISDGRGVLVNGWWVTFFPGLALLVVVMSVNLLGDWMRDRFDPRENRVTEAGVSELEGKGAPV